MTGRVPLQAGLQYLTWVGMETDLIFNRGMELPGFASFPLLETAETRDILLDYALEQIDLTCGFGFGTILESATWMANRDRAAALGYGPAQLDSANRDAVALLLEARARSDAQNILISANIGPRADAYAPGETMTAAAAKNYHSAQITSLLGSGVDMISAYTMTSSDEATGIVQAAAAEGMPVVVAFTVETDGNLPGGQVLDQAIAATDAATDGAAAYFMVNCAHPEHFGARLTGNSRIGGVVVNASRCSHAELDDAETLDDGHPDELGRQVAEIAVANPAMQVFGGCCGTDMRHMRAIAQHLEDAR